MAFPLALRSDRASRRDMAAGLIALLLTLGALIGAWRINEALSLKPGPNEYNIPAWEARNIPNKWLFLLGQLIRGTPTTGQQNANLQRFFDLTGQIESLESQISDASLAGTGSDATLVARLDALRSERASRENQAEATIELRLKQVVRDQHLARDFGISIVWPPIDAEFTDAPRNLAISPRDHIELTGTRLLREDLSLVQVEQIEGQTEAKENVAALAFPLGGLGAYPTIVDYPDSYRNALELVAHEWMHNYLFFRPLGFHYYGSNDLRTMNETVADLVGHELANDVIARWPLEPPPPATGAAPPQPQAPGFDIRAELRRLRGEVDVLLAQGKIDEAEALMEQRRQEFAAQGYYIRKINQAYFAYLNLYAGEAGSPAAVNPIGPKIDELRKRSASLQQFVSIVGSVTSVRELDAALARLQ